MTDTSAHPPIVLVCDPDQLPGLWPHLDHPARPAHLVVDVRPTPPAAAPRTASLIRAGLEALAAARTAIEDPSDDSPDPAAGSGDEWIDPAAWAAAVDGDTPERCDIAEKTFPADATSEDAGGPDDDTEGPLLPAVSGPSDPPANAVEEGVEPGGLAAPVVRRSPTGAAAPPSSTPAQLTDQLVEMLEEHPGKAWTVGQILEHFPPGRHSSVRSTLANLARKGLIRRVSAGTYQALAAAAPAPGFPSAEAVEEVDAVADALDERVLAVLESDPVRRYCVAELVDLLDEPADAVRTACYRLAAAHQVNQLGPAEFRFLDIEDLTAARRETAAEEL